MTSIKSIESFSSHDKDIIDEFQIFVALHIKCNDLQFEFFRGQIKNIKYNHGYYDFNDNINSDISLLSMMIIFIKSRSPDDEDAIISYIKNKNYFLPEIEVVFKKIT